MDFAKIRPRGGTKAQWETANPVLGKREMGVQWESEIGVGKVVIKFGNGVTAWNNLDTAVEVENDLVNKIISSIVTVSDEYPILNDGDSLSTLVGKIKKYIQDLKDKKLDKSARYDGTDSTSIELVPTANALRGVNAKADKNASDITTLNNNLSNAGIPTVKKITDLYAIKKSGFYYYDAGATNAPMSSRGGMIVANYLSDSWISLTVVPYALSKKYTNTKYNNTWVGWAESATKNDLLISASGTGPTDWTALETVENMPFKIWNVTKASTSKGAPAGCYDYGTLIALVATATGDRWRNTLIYLPDNNNNVGNKVYVRSGISTKWLAISGTDVNSVS